MKKKVGFYPYEHYSQSNTRKKDFDVSTLNRKIARFFACETAIPTYDGKEAVKLIIESLDLKRNDEILISTTFDYPNVSSCVTSTIFNFCKPSRVWSASTKAVIVIHEFGVYHEDTPGLKKECERRGIPLIEDLAHTIIATSNSGIKAGYLGDWIILSLSKLFPVVNGGYLLGKSVDNHFNSTKYNGILDQFDEVDKIWDNLEETVNQRMNVFKNYATRFRNLPFNPLVNESNIEFPWFFPVLVSSPDAYIEWMRSQGIDAGLWHGSNVVVLPLHQYLTEEDIDYIANRTKLFVSNNRFD